MHLIQDANANWSSESTLLKHKFRAFNLWIKPTAHDASFLAGSLAGRFYAGCAALSQTGRDVGLASYGADCRVGLQARCCSFVAHERAQTMHAPLPRESRDIFLASDWLSGSARKETRRENSTDSILEIPHASPHRGQHWRYFLTSQPAWQPARLPASDPARKLASCAPDFYMWRDLRKGTYDPKNRFSDYTWFYKVLNWFFIGCNQKFFF